MALDLLDKSVLAELLPLGESERRAGLLIPDIAAAYQSSITLQLDAVDRMMDLVAVDARWKADIYWESVRNPLEGDDGFCRIATRVTYRNGYVSMQWLRNRYVKQPDNKPSKVYSTYIRKGSSSAYSMRDFKNEPGWVRDLVEATEAEYVVLRERATKLSTLRRTLRAMQKELTEQWGEV